MKINGYELNLSEEELNHILEKQTREIKLVTHNFAAYQALSEGDKKAFEHLCRAAHLINDVALEQDNALNRPLLKALETEALHSEYAAKALKLFKSLNGVAGLNGIDPEPVQIFKGLPLLKGRNFYPADLSVEEFQQILIKMAQKGMIDEIRRILSARTMVRREGSLLKAIDYTEYFAQAFSDIANELEVAAHYTTDSLLKDYLGWQAQALLQNNPEMDALADEHWAQMQFNAIEFTISRENYEDEMTGTVYDYPLLADILKQNDIQVVSKDTLGCRVGFLNLSGTNLILESQKGLPLLALQMPFADCYKQSVRHDVKQTMVDADLALLTGDYAMCRGGITTAQNLPNDDKLAVQRGLGRRNVYHRQVRAAVDLERQQKILDMLVAPELHAYIDVESRHYFVIGHENGHSLGPDNSYKNALGVYQHVIEEHKANTVSIAFMHEQYSGDDLKKIYATWVLSLFLQAKPVLSKPHRVADLIEFNFLLENEAIFFDENKKLHIRFEKIQPVVYDLLKKTIEVQLSRSSQSAEEFINRWSNWGELNAYIAQCQKSLGLKPYIRLVADF